MSAQEKHTKSFVVDTNLFVAAIKPFSRLSRRSRSAETKSLSLLVKLIMSDELELKGNSILMNEYRRFAQELHSEASRLILKQLIEKTAVVDVTEYSIDRCKPYFPTLESADIIHAATCLQTDSILITNDRHFREIKESGKIVVWSITEAMRNLL